MDLLTKTTIWGEEVNLKCPNVNVLVDLIKKHGRNCLIFKRDLSRAYTDKFLLIYMMYI